MLLRSRQFYGHSTLYVHRPSLSSGNACWSAEERSQPVPILDLPPTHQQSSSKLSKSSELSTSTAKRSENSKKIKAHPPLPTSHLQISFLPVIITRTSFGFGLPLGLPISHPHPHSHPHAPPGSIMHITYLPSSSFLQLPSLSCEQALTFALAFELRVQILVLHSPRLASPGGPSRIRMNSIRRRRYRILPSACSNSFFAGGVIGRRLAGGRDWWTAEEQGANEICVRDWDEMMGWDEMR